MRKGVAKAFNVNQGECGRQVDVMTEFPTASKSQVVRQKEQSISRSEQAESKKQPACMNMTNLQQTEITRSYLQTRFNELVCQKF